MKFEWNEKKNQLNIEKHNIDFNDIVRIFNNTMLIKEDNRHDYGEQRYIGIGIVQNIEIVIVWTIRNNNIRIISARKANKIERKALYDSIKNN